MNITGSLANAVEVLGMLEMAKGLVFARTQQQPRLVEPASALPQA